MNSKWLGAILIITGCGGYGFSLAAAYRHQERLLHQLLHVLKYMENELKYRLTPLPELCRLAGKETGSVLESVLYDLAEALDAHTSVNVEAAMASALEKVTGLPLKLRALLMQLGRSLGTFDLPGQLQGLQVVYFDGTKELEELTRDKNTKIRSCQTLSLCAGAALAILFI